MLVEVSVTGVDPGFSNRGGAIDYVHSAHITSVKLKVPYGWGPGPAEGPWMLEGFRCYLSIWALFWSILMQNWIKKKNIQWKFRGGARLLDPPLCYLGNGNGNITICSILGSYWAEYKCPGLKTYYFSSRHTRKPPIRSNFSNFSKNYSFIYMYVFIHLFIHLSIACLFIFVYLSAYKLFISFSPISFCNW